MMDSIQTCAFSNVFQILLGVGAILLGVLITYTADYFDRPRVQVKAKMRESRDTFDESLARIDRTFESLDAEIVELEEAVRWYEAELANCEEGIRARDIVITRLDAEVLSLSLELENLKRSS